MSISLSGVSPLPALAPAEERAVATALTLPKALLCDLDGTLIDSMPTLADLATEVMADVFGTPQVLARELYLATCGLPFIRQLETLFPGDPRNQHASDRFEGEKPARCSAIALPHDVRAALQAFKDRGVAIVVSSNNGVENVDTFAARSGFDFALALGFGGGLAKGAPHFALVEAKLGIRRAEMLFVGDSLHDGDIAEREGVPFVGVAGTFSADRFALRFPSSPVVRRFSDLPALFERRSAPRSAAAERTSHPHPVLPRVGSA